MLHPCCYHGETKFRALDHTPHMPLALILMEAEAEERAALAAIGAREIAVVKAWIAGGCEGPQPRPDEAERLRLSERLKAAMAAREAA